ncbi:unnamed protein product, partial [Prorocentrum cordatum]
MMKRPAAAHTAAPPQKRRVAFDQSIDVVPVIREHIKSAALLPHREELKGVMDLDKLRANKQLIGNPPGCMPQTYLYKQLETFATEKEDQWHLAGELPGWCDKMAKRIRAMRSDVGQMISKAKKDQKKPAQWLKTHMEIIADSTFSDADGEPAEPDEGGDDDDEVPADGDGEQDEPGDEPADAEGEDAPKEGDNSNYTFEWDDDMKACYRTNLESGKKDRSGPPYAPDGAGAEDQAAVKWSDGMVWSVPTLSVQDLQGGAKSSNISLRVDGPDAGGITYVQKRKNNADFVLLIRARDAGGKEIQVTSLIWSHAAETDQTYVLDQMHAIAKDYADGKLNKETATQRKKDLDTEITQRKK